MSDTLFHSTTTPYSDAEQRDVANHLGMWTFLATEILFFGGLFACYSVYRWTYPQAFIAGSHHLEFWIGTTNTAVLLTSSLTMALSDLAVKRNARGALAGWLVLTWLLGLTFLGLKFFEYYQKYTEHLIPGANFHFAAGEPKPMELFIFLYFAMTGLHAVHMIIGLGAIAWLLRLNRRGRLTTERHAPVAMVGLYWHFVDCVWIFLYPLLYLVR